MNLKVNMNRIAIYGAGGFAREVAWLAESCGHRVLCFVDDNPALFGKRINDIPVMSLEEAAGRFAGSGIVSGIGSPPSREVTVKKAVTAGFAPVSLVHPQTQMSRWIEMGDGIVICAGCILTTNIRLGNQVQVNLDCKLGHDVIMGDYTTLAPGVHVSGYVHFLWPEGDKAETMPAHTVLAQQRISIVYRQLYLPFDENHARPRADVQATSSLFALNIVQVLSIFRRKLPCAYRKQGRKAPRS